jgi:hypothetical protein
MPLPVDANRLQCLPVGAAEQLRRYEEGKRREDCAPKVDQNGEVLYGQQLVVMWDGDAAIIRVSVPGDPQLKQGEMVHVEGLTAQPWEMDGKFGLSFRANAIRPVGQRAEKAAA